MKVTVLGLSVHLSPTLLIVEAMKQRLMNLSLKRALEEKERVNTGCVKLTREPLKHQSKLNNQKEKSTVTNHSLKIYEHQFFVGIKVISLNVKLQCKYRKRCTFR